MNIGGEADPGRIRSEHWHTLARDIGMRSRFVMREIESMVDAINEAMPAVRTALEESNGALPMLQQPEKVIRKQLRIARGLSV
jgi:hypothetical protein